PILDNAALYSPTPLCNSTLNNPTSMFYILSLHDALPILQQMSTCVPAKPLELRCSRCSMLLLQCLAAGLNSNNPQRPKLWMQCRDRKSTRLNSSHVSISYAVFCLTKKNKENVQSVTLI